MATEILVSLSSWNGSPLSADADLSNYVSVHNAPTGSDIVTFCTPGQAYHPGAPDTYFVLRSAIVFDISIIPAGATVIATTLSMMGYGDYSDTDFDITLVSGEDLADIFVPVDYGDLLDDVTSFGELTTVGFLVDDWNVITLNAAGLAALQAAINGGTGRFRLGIRSSRDISATTPKLDGALNNEYVNFYGDPVDPVNTWPKLTVTYTLVALPTVTTDPATEVGIASATLNGTLTDDGGEACNCGFEWGKSVAYGASTPTESKITGQSFSQIIAPLEPATTYHFRAFATNSVGTSYGADIEIRTYPVLSRAYSLSKEEL